MRRRISDTVWLISIIVTLNIIGCAVRETVTTQKDIKETQGCLYGLFMTNTPVNLRHINSFEMKSQKKTSMIMFYTNWDRDFPMDDCVNIVNYGAIAHITWEPWLNLNDIIEGKRDEYIARWAEEAKDFRHPFFLRWGHEMNGNWYPWGGAKNNNDPSKYVKAYQHIHKIFKNIGATNAIWVWAPMDNSVPRVGWNNAENYYPGDEYVDWLGIDGYNWGITQSWSHWISFDNIFRDRFREFIKKYPNKPIMIAEFASAEKGGNKKEWITETFKTIKEEYPQIKAIVWFNINKECDWRINSSSDSLESFKLAIKDSYFLSDPEKMSRLLKGFELPEGVTTELAPLKIAWQKPQVIIVKAKEPIIVDGELNEWQMAESIVLDNRKKIVLGIDYWRGKEDLSAKVMFMWDEENFYVAAVVCDDYPLVNKFNSDEIWNGDGLEIAFSTDPEADSLRTSFSPNDYQIALGAGYYGETQPSSWSWQMLKPIDGIEIAILPAEDFKSYYLEAKIPFFEVFDLELKKGMKLDFNVVINDADETEVRETQFVWSGDNMFYQQPYMWGEAIFVER